jgi:hypothetical protein
MKTPVIIIHSMASIPVIRIPVIIMPFLVPMQAITTMDLPIHSMVMPVVIIIQPGVIMFFSDIILGLRTLKVAITFSLEITVDTTIPPVTGIL